MIARLVQEFVSQLSAKTANVWAGSSSVCTTILPLSDHPSEPSEIEAYSSSIPQPAHHAFQRAETVSRIALRLAQIREFISVRLRNVEYMDDAKAE